MNSLKILLGAVMLFFVTIEFRHYVAFSWDVVDPATNHLGWYAWSLMVTALSWQWYAACLLHVRAGTRQKIYLFMVVMVIVESILYQESGWTYAVYPALSPSEHHVLCALDLNYDVLEGLLLAYLAIISTERLWTLVMVIPVVALKVFVGEVVPGDLSPVQTEIIMSLAVLLLYIVVIMNLKMATWLRLR